MLDQMMILAADQSTKNYQLLDAVSHNIGNYNVWGYKSTRFDQYLRPDSNLDQTKRVDYAQGSVFSTKRELDVALKGPGFIQVTRPNGEIAYTRSGNFAKDAEGYLVTPYGDRVGEGIRLPANYSKVRFKPDGRVLITPKPGDEPQEIGRLVIRNFPNPEGLKSLGQNLVQETSESGAPQAVDEPNLVVQGHLEYSNVNIHQAVVDILRINAGVISNLRVVKAIDDIYREAVNLRGQ